jgi:hypothetical protein
MSANPTATPSDIARIRTKLRLLEQSQATSVDRGWYLRDVGLLLETVNESLRSIGDTMVAINAAESAAKAAVQAEMAALRAENGRLKNQLAASADDIMEGR